MTCFTTTILRNGRVNATSTYHAHWYVVPSDDKENAQAIVSQIILDVFDELKMAYPKTTVERRKEWEARKLLEK